MVVVNCINISDICNEEYMILKSYSSKNRRKKAERFHFMEDSLRCLCADFLLKYSLYEKLKCVNDFDIHYNDFGKPFIKELKGFSYNISHSGVWVVIAYGESEVGIDIEKISLRNDSICDIDFNEKEKKWIHEVSGDTACERFINMWTCKESYLKYIGTGLSTRLDSFFVNAEDGTVTNSDGTLQGNVRIKSYLFDKEYYLSVCSDEDDIRINKIPLDELIKFAQVLKRNKLL